MPAGDYTNCVKCGRGIFGYGLCNECDKIYNIGTSYDFYGNSNNTYVSPVLPPNPNGSVQLEQNESHSKYCKCDECECDRNDEIIKSSNKNPNITNDETLDEIFDKFLGDFSKTEWDRILNDIINETPATAPKTVENKPLKRKTLIVNLYAGPGSGKSTTAAGVFFELKSRGINCELATEFVKDLVWEERHKAINNQVYIFAKQHHRITRLLGEVDVIITDSPLLLTLVYGKDSDAALKQLAKVEHDKLWTYNCFIKRNKQYNPKGRLQTYDEARRLDRAIATMLDNQEVPYEVYFGNAEGKNKIVDKILRILGEK